MIPVEQYNLVGLTEYLDQFNGCHSHVYKDVLTIHVCGATFTKSIIHCKQNGLTYVIL